MGIVRTVEWSLLPPPAEAQEHLRAALVACGMELDADDGPIRAKSKRAVMKNRWAAEVGIDVAPLARIVQEAA